MRRLLSGISLVVLMAAAESACQKKHVALPTPPPPSPTATAPEEPPPTTVNPPTQPAPAQPTPPATTPEETPKTPPRRAPRPVPATPVSPPNTPAPPRLGDMLTPDQQRQYNAGIDQSLARAQASLGAISNRRLTKEQQYRAAQVRTFIQQAQDTRESNLPGAKSLAERAEVLARDLAASLR